VGTGKDKISYGAHDDYRFPITLLFKAYWVLENDGYDDFRKYCVKVDMPVQDIERVINKYQYATDPKFRVKINKIMQEIRDKLEGTGLQVRIPF
jgi:hypothetical protein